MENPFEYDEKELEDCIELVSANIPEIDEDKLELDTIFYTAAKYLREHESFQDILDWITFFEREFDCAGVCKTSLFSWTKSIEEGRPQQYCMIGVAEELKPHLTGLAFCCFASGVLLFLIFICQYCLWAKYKSDTKGLNLTTTSKEQSASV